MPRAKNHALLVDIRAPSRLRLVEPLCISELHAKYNQHERAINHRNREKGLMNVVDAIFVGAKIKGCASPFVRNVYNRENCGY